MSERSKDSNDYDSSSGTVNLLPRLSRQHLRSIKVVVRRHNVPEPTTPVVVHRALEDPRDLVIYRREGEGQHPIFDRRGIVVNVEKNLEERIVLKSPVRREVDKEISSRSRSRSTDSYRARSGRRYSQSPSTSVRKDAKTAKQSGARNRSRTASPHYKKQRRKRTPSKEKFYKDRSPKPGTSKEGRDRDSFIDKKGYKGSPRRDYKDGSPRRCDRNRSRSQSPRKFHYKAPPGDKEKYARLRSPAPSKRYSTSPHGRKRSRSPHSRRRTPSPWKRRSRSPHTRRTPSRDERSKDVVPNKSRRRTPSPYDKEKDYCRKSEYSKRRSRSPYRRHSRSPYRSEHKYKRRSRSPFRKEDYRRGRSKSPTKSRHSKLKEEYKSGTVEGQEESEGNFNFYGEGYWIPNMPGGIPPPGYLPSMPFPRVLLQPPHMLMRPYPPPMGPHHMGPFPRYGMRYPRMYRPRPPAPPVAITTAATAAASSEVATITTSTPTSTVVTESISANPIIEEPASEAENVESTVN